VARGAGRPVRSHARTALRLTGPAAPVYYVVMHDPVGNEFCAG
jgi:hypothetical protein